MIQKKLLRLWRRRKAVSPVIATILLIALTVTAAAIVYFVVVPLLRGNPELSKNGEFIIIKRKGVINV